MATEFAREFPKVAARLALDDFPCVDPYVERLLEGFAFLAARVQLKLEAEFPRFTQSLLETAYPHYLAPTPSMCVAEFSPDLAEAGLAKGYKLPRGTVLRSLAGKGELTTCEYRTAHEVTLFPIQVSEVQYYTRDVGLLDLGESTAGLPPVRAALRIRLTAHAGLTFNKIAVSRLVFNLRGAGMIPLRLYEQVVGHGRAALVRPVSATPSRGPKATYRLESTNIERVGFQPEEALLPFDARSFQGYRLLHEYFAFPHRYAFFAVSNLAEVMARCQTNTIDIVIPLDQEAMDLEGVIDKSHVGLFATPAINLFPKRADRIFISERFSEFHVIPDRTRPLDFEVYSVQGITGYGARADEQTLFRPFYSARDTDMGTGGAYFGVSRVPRAQSEQEKRGGRRSSYAGSDVYVSLVDSANQPFSAELRQLAVDTLCTNRDLPLQMSVGRGPTDFTLDIGAPVAAVRVVAGPTAPRPSHVEPRGNQPEGEAAWRLISHLSLNYLSLTDAAATASASAPRAGSAQIEGEGAGALREILRLYADNGDAAIRKQVEGVRNVAVRSITRRVPTPGPIVFGRGLEVTVTLDELSFEGTGIFLLGAVLEQFFARYVTINSFTETVIVGTERGEIMRWPARLGRSPLL